MLHQFEVEDNVYSVVADLQHAGYETYIVGGAIRDLLKNRPPKDYDISTAATPEEIKEVFGRRRARIIGRRFQLVHVRSGSELFEVSTFRRAPEEKRHEPQTPGARKIAELEEAGNMIFNDNDFGTAEEDAWRRDFTVNALFYDPVADELIDYTGQGLKDIENGLIRAIGDAKLRFEEDPVRMLRALKLVGQYGFTLEAETQKALRSTLPLLELSSVSRLSLELEKVLNSNYAGSIMQAFADYKLLPHFLPNLTDTANKTLLDQALALLKKRDQRVLAGYYRNSASVAMATLALPFINHALGDMPPVDGNPVFRDEDELRHQLLKLYAPLAIIKRLSCSACRMLELQPLFFSNISPRKLMRNRGFAHAMELFKIQCDADYLECSSEIITKWRDAIINAGGVNRNHSDAEDNSEEYSQSRRRRRRGKRRNNRNHHADLNRESAEKLIHQEIAAASEDLQLGF